MTYMQWVERGTFSGLCSSDYFLLRRYLRDCTKTVSHEEFDNFIRHWLLFSDTVRQEVLSVVNCIADSFFGRNGFSLSDCLLHYEFYSKLSELV